MMKEMEEVKDAPTANTPMRIARRENFAAPVMLFRAERHPIKEIIVTSLKLAGPMMMVSVVVTGSSFTSAFIMSYLGPEVYQATSLMTLMEWTLPIFSNIAAIATIAAQHNPNRGEDDNQEYRIIVGPSMRSSHIGPVAADAQLSDLGRIDHAGKFIALVAGIPLGVIFYFSEPILLGLNQPANLAKIAGTFSKYYIIGIPGYLLSTASIQMANALGFQWPVLISQTIGAVIGNGLGAILVNFTDLNVKGMALGIAAQYWSAFLFMTGYYFYKSKTDPNIRAAEFFRWHGASIFPHMKKILLLGAAIAGFVGTEVLAFLLNLLTVGWMGSEELAAIETAFLYIFILIIPIYSLSDAANIEISKHLALRRYDDVRAFGNVNIIIGAVYGAAAMAMFEIFPRPLCLLFIEKEATHTLELAVSVMRHFGFSFIADAIRIISGGDQRGLESVYMTAATSVIGLWLLGALPSAIMVKYGIIALPGLAWMRNMGLAVACVPQVFWWLYKAAQIDDQSTIITRFMDKLLGCCRRPRPRAELEPPATAASRFTLFADTDHSINSEPEDIKLTPQQTGYPDNEDPVFERESRCTIL